MLNKTPSIASCRLAVQQQPWTLTFLLCVLQIELGSSRALRNIILSNGGERLVPCRASDWLAVMCNVALLAAVYLTIVCSLQIARLHQEFVFDTLEVDSGRSDSETVSAEFVRRSGTGRRKKNVPFQSPLHSSK